MSTALPTIVDSIPEFSPQDFIWVPAAYALAAATLLPMSGCLAEVIEHLSSEERVADVKFMALGRFLEGALFTYFVSRLLQRGLPCAVLPILETYSSQEGVSISFKPLRLRGA